jgi:hypothetical protein
MTSSSSTSIEDLSRFATSTASSSKTSLELIVDQEKDMSVSTLSLFSRIESIFIYHRMEKGHSGLISLTYSVTDSPLPTTPPINLTSSSSAQASQAAASPTPSPTPATASSSSNVTSLLPIA